MSHLFLPDCQILPRNSENIPVYLCHRLSPFLDIFPSSLDIFGIQCSSFLSITYGPSSQLWANGLPRMNDIDLWKTGAAQGGTGCAIPPKTGFFFCLLAISRENSHFTREKRQHDFPKSIIKTTSQHWFLSSSLGSLCVYDWVTRWHAFKEFNISSPSTCRMR